MSELAVITGAGSGIGAALAIHLATTHNLHVLLVGRRADALAATAARCPTGTATPCAADLTAPTSPSLIADAIAAMGLRVRFLIHNAGTLGPIASLADTPRAEWEATLATNVTGPLFLTQKLLPHLAPRARILHISSGAAQRAFPGWGCYCASKAALNMVYRVLSAELQGLGVAVGSARPGVVETAMQGRIREEGGGVAAFKEHARFVALKAGMAEEEAGGGDGSIGGGAPPPAAALDTPENVAVFLSFLLTRTEDEEFAATEWDIRDVAHQARWCVPPHSPSPPPHEEKFDVLDASGAATGATAPRSLVHATGLFHKAAHVWVLSPYTGELLLQRRAACKDSWPSLLDCSAAGHVSAGEAALPSALRELEEELGLRVLPSRLRFLFTHLERAATLQKGRPFFNNEFQDVFLLCVSREEREALKPEEAELREGVVEVAVEAEAGEAEELPPLTRFRLQASEVSSVEWRKWRAVEAAYRARSATIVPWGEAPPPSGGAASSQQVLFDAIVGAVEGAAEAELAAALSLVGDMEANCDALSAALQEHVDTGGAALKELSSQMQSLLGLAGTVSGAEGGGEEATT